MGGVHMAPNVGNAVSFGEISSSAMTKSGLHASMSSEVTTENTRWPSFSAAHLKRRMNAISAESTRCGQLLIRAMSISMTPIKAGMIIALRSNSAQVGPLAVSAIPIDAGFQEERLIADTRDV